MLKHFHRGTILDFWRSAHAYYPMTVLMLTTRICMAPRNGTCTRIIFLFVWDPNKLAYNTSGHTTHATCLTTPLATTSPFASAPP